MRERELTSADAKPQSRAERLGDGAKALLAYTPLRYMLDFATQNPWGARVWEDRPRDPSRCVLRIVHTLFLGGRVDEAYLAEALDALLPPASRPDVTELIAYAPDDAGRAVLAAYGRNVWQGGRRLFRQAVPQPEGEPDPRVALIDERLMHSATRGLDMIREEVESTATWRDMREFCLGGLGFAYVEDGRALGFCTGEYPSMGAVAAGIFVCEDARRRGVGSAMARAFARRAAQRGLAAYWECWAGNEPSVRTALACGFVPVAEYPCVYLELHKTPEKE